MSLIEVNDKKQSKEKCRSSHSALKTTIFNCSPSITKKKPCLCEMKLLPLCTDKILLSNFRLVKRISLCSGQKPLGRFFSARSCAQTTQQLRTKKDACLAFNEETTSQQITALLTYECALTERKKNLPQQRKFSIIQMNSI